MIDSMKMDQEHRPELFDWHGAVGRQVVESWLREHGWVVPKDLIDFWSETGGGDMFESETMLSPFGGDALGDNVAKSNEVLLAEGLPEGHLVFHIGFTLSAVRFSDQRYVCLNRDDFSVESEYSSLEEWYEQLMRDEFRDRYGLPKTAS